MRIWWTMMENRPNLFQQVLCLEVVLAYHLRWSRCSVGDELCNDRHTNRWIWELFYSGSTARCQAEPEPDTSTTGQPVKDPHNISTVVLELTLGGCNTCDVLWQVVVDVLISSTGSTTRPRSSSEQV